MNFFEVKIAGATTLDQLDGGPPVDLPGYGLVGGRYYDINTTADYGDPLRVCLPYDPADFETGPARLIEFDGGEWTDITVSNDHRAPASSAASRRTSACSRSPRASTCRRWR